MPDQTVAYTDCYSRGDVKHLSLSVIGMERFATASVMADVHRHTDHSPQCHALLMNEKFPT
jgi:hypothetical protein